MSIHPRPAHPALLVTAWHSLPQAIVKLDPRHVFRSPVMFVVWVGSVLTTVLSVVSPSVFAIAIAAWLWLTIVFANLAEAIAEGRGKAQADTLRKTRTQTLARRLLASGEEKVPGTALRLGDLVVVEAGEVIPGDGDVVEGVATVDESAITGESAPVIRAAGGDRSAVTGGTMVLSDRIVVQITAQPGESFLDRMIALVEGADRRKTPNEIALNILLAAMTAVFLVIVWAACWCCRPRAPRSTWSATTCGWARWWSYRRPTIPCCAPPGRRSRPSPTSWPWPASAGEHRWCYGAAATWSAAWARRSPSGCSGPAVVSLAVCNSISVFSSAPSSTVNALRYSQNIRMMMPARAP
jgi:hypothetical protein